jgi:phosphate:Na+ symporter
MLPVYERLSRILIPDKAEKTNVNAKLVDALSPAFFDTPALAFRSCYNVMCKMLDLATGNFYRAVSLLRGYSDEVFENGLADEDAIDYVADRVGQYLGRAPRTQDRPYVGISTSKQGRARFRVPSATTL